MPHSGKGTSRGKAGWTVVLAVICFCGCALQEDLYTLDHRIAALERKNAQLEKENNELEKANQALSAEQEKVASQVDTLRQSQRDDDFGLRGKYAGMAAQLEGYRVTLQQHTGQLEEIDYLVNRKLKTFEENQVRQGERMDRLAGETAAVRKRVAAVEQYLNLPPPDGQKSTKPTTAKPEGAKPTSDKALYASAKKSFDAGNYDVARQAFQTLLERYPQSEHADNAQFWIAETYYNEKWYEKAILEYQKVIETYPSGNKVSAALLKQGLSFLNIGEAENARLLLQDLMDKYPGTQEAEAAKKKLEQLQPS